MELTSSIIPVVILLFTVKDQIMCNSNGITYSSDTLKDIGIHFGSRPTIAKSLFETLQGYGIGRIRPRGNRGGRSKRKSIADNITGLFVNKQACPQQNGGIFEIPVIVTPSRQVSATRSKIRHSNLISDISSCCKCKIRV